MQAVARTKPSVLTWGCGTHVRDFAYRSPITGACILECDSQHGEVEKYDKRGKHLGAFDPKTGKQLKDPIKNRRIEL